MNDFNTWSDKEKFRIYSFLGASITSGYGAALGYILNTKANYRDRLGRLGKNQLAWCEANIPGFKNLLEDE